LSFIHWRADRRSIQALLPEGLTVDLFDGTAWVALVPFRMTRVRPAGLPAVPWVSTFPEKNVRTYVRDRSDGTGVWFSSLDIPRASGVALARSLFRIPYMWASMTLHRNGDRVSYRSRRRWPRPRGAGCDIEVVRGGPAERSELLDFLTNRWRAYTTDRAGAIVYAPVAHEPWRLYEATATRLVEDLLPSAGINGLDGPLVHFSPGVTARVGMLRSV